MGKESKRPALKVYRETLKEMYFAPQEVRDEAWIAIIIHFLTGEAPELQNTDAKLIAEEAIEKSIRDEESYQVTCTLRSEAGKRGGRPTKNPKNTCGSRTKSK